MHKSGCVVLTIWLCLNLIPSCLIIFGTLAGAGHTPAIHSLLSDSEIAALHPHAIATIDSIAVFANGLNLAFCSIALLVVWFGVYQQYRWAYWGLIAGFACAILAGIGSDYVVGTQHPFINAISFAIVAIGMGLSAVPTLARPIDRLDLRNDVESG